MAACNQPITIKERTIMQWFSDLRIGARLGFGFALVLVMTASVALVGISRMSAIKKDFNTVVKSNNVKIAMANGMRGQLNLVARASRNIILQKDPVYVQKQVERLTEARKKYDEMSTKLSSLIITEKAKKLMEELNSARDTVRPFFSKTIDMALAGKRDEASKFLLLEVTGPQEKWFAAIQAMIELQEAQSLQLIDASEKSYNSAFELMVGMAAGSILMGALFAFFVTKSVTRPINKAVEVANQLAQGDLAISITETGKDEAGKL